MSQMLQAFADAFSSPKHSPQSSPVSSPQSAHVNMSPRVKTKGVSLRFPGQDSGKEAEKVISQLQNELQLKESMIASLTSKLARLEVEPREEVISIPPSFKEGAEVQRRHHPVSSVAHIIQDNQVSHSKVGTRGSMLTTNVLEAMGDSEKSETQLLAEKFVQIFQNPVEHMEYLQSKTFATDLTNICEAVQSILENESRCLFLQSPVYVFGDIHGNLEDLHFFADNIWKLGMDLTAGRFLFLGDYVDRGPNCLECVAYLFSLKLLYPKKISLLRGNHETRDVNGWEDHYREKSFLFQCKDRFRADVGEAVWEECNQTFDRLPFSAIIDHEIFCIHGGIPRRVADHKTEIHAIMAMPNVAAVMPSYDYETEWMKQVAADCIWSDPAPESMEPRLGADGFGSSPRGGGAVCFGTTAIDNFLEANGLSYIIRAHEAHSHGVCLSKGARVFTVFSTSKDHRQGSRAMAGCILVDVDMIQVINRSPKYRNKYVHRRTSVSLKSLSEEEIEARRKLGLVRTSIMDADYYAMKREREVEDAKKADGGNDENSPGNSQVARAKNCIPTF